MEKISGIHLADVWDELEPSDKLKVVVQVFKYQRLWTTTKFTRFGGLYYAKDVDTPPLFDECLYIDKDGQAVEDSRFAVGPAVSRECVNDGKQKIQCDRGPCKSHAEMYLRSQSLTSS